jgi:3-oxoacyl-[acyl-carrier protein] reductase
MAAARALDFGNHVVLVTGAGAGIGLGIARAFLDAGARVAIGDVREAPLRRAASELDAGGRVFAQALDVRDGKSVAAFLAGAEQALGPVTVVVANAGIYPNTPVLEMTVEEWDRVMETNVRGVFLTCQAAARRMVAQGTPGKIITISSGAYVSGRPGAAHYCASKAAVVMFTKVLALELAGHRINVNCIAPGFVRVDSEVSPLTEEYVTAITRGIPWGRQGTPLDIANAALFLASPLADYVTGEVLAVNGGASAGRSQLPLSTPREKGSAR